MDGIFGWLGDHGAHQDLIRHMGRTACLSPEDLLHEHPELVPVGLVHAQLLADVGDLLGVGDLARQHLRGVAGRSHASAVPGVRTCSLRGSAVIGGESRDVLLAVTWMRLPGGIIELQASAELDRTPFDLPESRLGWMLPRSEHCVLGIDLILRADR